MHKNPIIFVSGQNEFNQLSPDSNDATRGNIPIVNPPTVSTVNFQNLLCFSSYFMHSVLIKKNGDAYAIGDNTQKVIYANLPGKVEDWTQIKMNDEQNQKLSFISAVCGSVYTLYLVESPNAKKLPFLALVYQNQNNGFPLFLDTGDMDIIGLFGGRQIAGAIDKTGSIVIISQYLFNNPNKKPIIAVLPNDEKAIQLACLHHSYVALSSTGKLYEFDLQNDKQRYPIFNEIKKMSKYIFTQIAGTWEHCLALTNDGKIYGFGANHFGHLGKSRDRRKTTEFELINTFKSEVKSVFAGSFHTFYVISKKKVVSCGRNKCGELMIIPQPNEYAIFKPLKTILENVTFCIAGCNTSFAFVNAGPPPNTPNQKIDLNLLDEKVTDSDVQNSTFRINRIRRILMLCDSIRLVMDEISEYHKQTGKLQSRVKTVNEQIVQLNSKIIHLRENNIRKQKQVAKINETEMEEDFYDNYEVEEEEEAEMENENENNNNDNDKDYDYDDDDDDDETK